MAEVVRQTGGFLPRTAALESPDYCARSESRVGITVVDVLPRVAVLRRVVLSLSMSELEHSSPSHQRSSMLLCRLYCASRRVRPTQSNAEAPEPVGPQPHWKKRQRGPPQAALVGGGSDSRAHQAQAWLWERAKPHAKKCTIFLLHIFCYKVCVPYSCTWVVYRVGLPTV